MTTMHHYVDRAWALGKLERTPQGGYRAPANLARAGIMDYTARELRKQGVELGAEFKDSDLVKIFTPPDVLQAAMETMRDATVTNEHPPRFVTPDTHKQLSCGHVQADTLEFDGEYVKAKLVIQESGLIGDIELNRRRGVSPGYTAYTDFTPGTTPDGRAYHGIRKKLEYNHCAVVSSPRGGPTVSLALDSDEIPTEKDLPPVTVKLKIKGVETDATTAQPVIDSLEGGLAAVTLERDGLKTEVADLKAKLADATSPEKISKYVADAKEVETKAQVKAAKVEAVKKAFPAMVLDGKSDDFVDGLFLAIPADPDGLNALRGTVVKDAKAPPAPAPKSSKRAEMISANRAQFGTRTNTSE